MNVCTRAMPDGKRAANSVIVRSVMLCETYAGGGFEPPTFGAID